MADILSVPLKQADGKFTMLSQYSGDVILVVNVASQCGLTEQYMGLQRLYDEKRGRGFRIVAFPAIDFKGQEPGTDAQPYLRRDVSDLFQNFGERTRSTPPIRAANLSKRHQYR